MAVFIHRTLLPEVSMLALHTATFSRACLAIVARKHRPNGAFMRVQASPATKWTQKHGALTRVNVVTFALFV